MRFLALTGASTLPVTMDLMGLSLLLIVRSLRNESPPRPTPGRAAHPDAGGPDSPPSSLSRSGVRANGRHYSRGSIQSSSFARHALCHWSTPVDAFSILRSCRRRGSPTTKRAIARAPQARKETAATCPLVRSNASKNRRSISIELCPAAVPAVVVVFVRLMVMPAQWRRQHLPGSARTNRRWHCLARGGARASSDAANCRCAAKAQRSNSESL